MRGGKTLLRRFVRGELPKGLSRRPKRGFEIPVDSWFRDADTADLRAQLSRGALVQHLDFSGEAVARLVARHLRGEDLGGSLSLLTLELWGRASCHSGARSG